MDYSTDNSNTLQIEHENKDRPVGNLDREQY